MGNFGIATAVEEEGTSRATGNLATPLRALPDSPEGETSEHGFERMREGESEKEKKIARVSGWVGVYAEGVRGLASCEQDPRGECATVTGVT
jgi:hypothetical protein